MSCEFESTQVVSTELALIPLFLYIGLIFFIDLSLSLSLSLSYVAKSYVGLVLLTGNSEFERF